MADTNEVKNKRKRSEPVAEYKDPLIAGLLAWLVPGLGHIYEKRYFKGILIFLCIVPTLLAGLWMGSYWQQSETGQTPQLARNVYFSWRTGDRRLYFIPQGMIGTVAIPAVFQAKNVARGNDGFFHNIFAPPRLPGEKSNQPAIDEIIANLNSWYEMGILFSMVAGLMNVLAILDAIQGRPRPEDSQETGQAAPV
ncbi:MAG: hypothetical protein Q4G68_10955 [Planctomycetia bacterium]|nr:hypothetical protein [Planctomycetia bacterium]